MFFFFPNTQTQYVYMLSKFIPVFKKQKILKVGVFMAKCWNIMELPEECISRIISLTSPRDACRLLAVSTGFRSPAESNTVWSQFLSAHSLPTINIHHYSSTKELFFLLSQSILIDGGYTVLGLEKCSGRRFYHLSARNLSILHGETGSNWIWKPIPESGFPEVAELVSVDRLMIHGMIRGGALSTNTMYGAYLVFRILENGFGLDAIPCETSIAWGGRVVTANTGRLRCQQDDDRTTKQIVEKLFYRNRAEMMEERVNKGGRLQETRKRRDGWWEMEVGEFFVNGDGQDEEFVEMRVMEIKGHQLKGGLLVQGIEIRPCN